MADAEDPQAQPEEDERIERMKEYDAASERLRSAVREVMSIGNDNPTATANDILDQVNGIIEEG